MTHGAGPGPPTRGHTRHRHARAQSPLTSSWGGDNKHFVTNKQIIVLVLAHKEREGIGGANKQKQCLAGKQNDSKNEVKTRLAVGEVFAVQPKKGVRQRGIKKGVRQTTSAAPCGKGYSKRAYRTVRKEAVPRPAALKQQETTASTWAEKTGKLWPPVDGTASWRTSGRQRPCY